MVASAADALDFTGGNVVVRSGVSSASSSGRVTIYTSNAVGSTASVSGSLLLSSGSEHDVGWVLVCATGHCLWWETWEAKRGGGLQACAFATHNRRKI